MKTRHHPFARSIRWIALIAPLSPLAAADLWHWNPDGAGGDGVWGTTPGEKNWNPVPGGPLPDNTRWRDGPDDIAVFSDGTGGLVTIFDQVSVAGIRQTGADYRIDAGTIILAADRAANAPFVDVAAGALTIDSPVAGADGLIKTGSGTLVLGAANPVTGVARVDAGTLRLTGSLASDEMRIADGATMLNPNGGLSSAAILANAGTLQLGADDTIAGYISNGGILSGGGSRQLTSVDASLNDGSVVDADLETEQLTTRGDVQFTGARVEVLANIGAVVESGTLTNEVTIQSPRITVRDGATLINEGGFGSSRPEDSDTVLINEGSFITRQSPVLQTYISNGGHLDIQDQRMVLENAQLNDGSITTGGPFSANLLTTNGIVRVDGRILGDNAEIQSGILTLGGGLLSRNVGIFSGASLRNLDGGLSSSATVTNDGTLELGADNPIAGYISNGGTLAAGPGTLFATTAELHDDSSVAGSLDAGTLTSHGAVSLSGTATAGAANISSGVTDLTGSLTADMLDIAAGASLRVGGSVIYQELTTSGAGPGFLKGNLSNATLVSPGGNGDFGTLAVTGNFTNAPGATMRFDLSAAGNDLLDVGGTATFGGTLDLRQAAGGPVAAFTPVTLVDAAEYAGNIDGLLSDLGGPVWFNPGNGTVTRLDGSTGGALARLSDSQRSTWLALYDDVVDPGIDNVGSGGPDAVTGGIASAANPDLLWALAATMTPGGPEGRVLNRLSPEVYWSLGGYATQATRQHQRAALSAPTLTPADTPAPVRSAKSAGAKSGSATTNGAVPAGRLPSGWALFAAANHFRADTSRAPNETDADLQGTGMLAGARGPLGPGGSLAFYLAADDGRIRGDLIRADASGFSLGVAADWIVHAATSTRLTTALSYGRYDFDGTRTSIAAPRAGWSPAMAGFSTTADSFEWFGGVESALEMDERLRAIPSLGLRLAAGSMDGFAEAGAAGGAIPLNVSQDHYHALLLEGGIGLEADVTERLTLRSDLGFSATLDRSDHGMAASFGGGRPIHAVSGGLSEDMLFLGIGAVIRASDDLNLGLGYRSEWRGGNDRLNSGSISASFRF